MTRACIHLGVHEHRVKDGEYQDFKERTRTLLGEQVERTPHATNSTIVMEATKELLGELLLAPQGVPAKTMTFEELVPVLNKCKYKTSPSVKTTSLHSGTYEDLGSWIASPCSEAAATSLMSRRTCSPAKALILIRCFCSRCPKWGQAAAWTWLSGCNPLVIFRTLGLCLTMSSLSRNGQRWLATSMTPPTAVL
jgi:hypothetical protein